MPRQSSSANGADGEQGTARESIDPDLLLSPFEHGVCGVCHHLMDTPTSGYPTGHTFCRNRYVTWLERDESCPTCRAKVDGERLMHILPLGNIIGDLPMKCKNSAAGCGWTGKVSELKSHLQSCAWVLVRCPIRGCSEQLARHSLEQHVDEAHVPRGESPAKLMLNAAEEMAKQERDFESRKRKRETRITDLKTMNTDLKTRITELERELESEKRLSTADEKSWVFNWRASG